MFIVSFSTDDMLIKLWDWEKEFQCVRVFEGHDDSIMTIALNPSNSNQFASASLDGTVKVSTLLLTSISLHVLSNHLIYHAI